MLPELLAQIAAVEPIESVCADRAYDMRDCLDAIAERQAVAVIPLGENASHCKRSTPGLRSGVATNGPALLRRRCTASSD